MTSPIIPIELPGQVGYLATATICMVLPTTLVILRIIGRRRTALAMNASDLCIVAALTFDIGLCIVDYFMVFKGGFGFHTSEIEKRFGPDTLTVFLKCIAAWPLLWNCCVMTSKWSVLLMYETLIPVPRMKLAVRIVGSFVTVFNLGGILEAFLICRPYEANWHPELGTCGDVRVFYIWLSALNLFSDLVILLLPIPFVYKLQLPLRKRLGLVGMFTVGVLTCVVTLYRQTTLPRMDLTDVTSSGLLAFLASTIEIAVAISIACLPFLRALWRASSCKGSSSNTYQNSSGYAGGGGGGGYYGSGYGGGGGSSRGAGRSGGGVSVSFSRGTRSPKSDGFGHLADDSSEIQLRPVVGGEGSLGQDTTIFAGARAGAAAAAVGDEDDDEVAYAGAGKGGLVVKVETRWDVETSSPVVRGLPQTR